MSLARIGTRPAARAAALGLSCLAAAALALPWFADRERDPRAAERPRHRPVILVVADTLRADRLSAYGYPRDTSPALARRAARGTRFERAFTAAPWTLPALASLLTSTWPRDHGAGLHGEERNLLHQVPDPLPAEGSATLAECLRGNGYPTAAIVTNPFFGFGLERGFERVDASYGIDALEVVKRGIEQLERWPDAGGFLYLHFMDVHDPLSPDDADLRALEATRALPARPQNLRDVLPRLHEPGTREERGWVYDAAIRRIDRALEQLFAHLERRGLLDEAIVVFTADHGEALWEHERIERWHYDRGATAGMGHGQSLFQELVGVPLVVWANELEDGTCATPVSIVDVMPSVLEWLDCPVPEHFATRGVSLSEVRAGRAAARDLVLEGIGMGRERTALVDAGGWKAISGDDRLDPKLTYDLPADPRERSPLPASERARALQGRVGGPRAFERKSTTASATSSAALESLRALGYLSGAEVGLPARGFGDGASILELLPSTLRELAADEGPRDAGSAREASVSSELAVAREALPQEGEHVALVPLPGGPHGKGEAAFLTVRARSRAQLEQPRAEELLLRLAPRGDTRLGIVGGAAIEISAEVDGTALPLPLASPSTVLPQSFSLGSDAALARVLPPIDAPSGAHLFLDPLLGQLRFQWIARAGDRDQAERVTLRFTSQAPLKAHAAPPAPRPHPSWSLIAATADGFAPVSTLVDPPLEGEAAILAGERVWVAGAGEGGSLWLYAFAFRAGKLQPEARLRLPADSRARVAALRAREKELEIEVRTARSMRRWALEIGR
ncbi:MAG: sulfatase [Planctomycetes bacterium]|nr:sulfatase [Planctomycetota bacterium]